MPKSKSGGRPAPWERRERLRDALEADPVPIPKLRVARADARTIIMNRVEAGESLLTKFVECKADEDRESTTHDMALWDFGNKEVISELFTTPYFYNIYAYVNEDMIHEYVTLTRPLGNGDREMMGKYNEDYDYVDCLTFCFRGAIDFMYFLARKLDFTEVIKKNDLSEGESGVKPKRVQPMSVNKVFLSSTGADLAAFRDAVFKAINGLHNWKCVRMEDFGAVSKSPLDFCLEEVKECNLFVGIVGHFHGSAPPGDTKSFTEHEYETTLMYNVPRLMFVAPDNFPIQANLVETSKKRRLQQDFRKKIGTQVVYASFSDPAELAQRVGQSIRNWEVQRR